jgi:hypothetical protein
MPYEARMGKFTSSEYSIFIFLVILIGGVIISSRRRKAKRLHTVSKWKCEHYGFNPDAHDKCPTCEIDASQIKIIKTC